MKTNNYLIHFKQKSKISEKELEVKIYLKLTDKEKELLESQQLQINDQQVVLGTEKKATVLEYYWVAFLVWKFLKKTKKDFEEKILIKTWDKSDHAVLKAYLNQLLQEVKTTILHKKINTK